MILILDKKCIIKSRNVILVDTYKDCMNKLLHTINIDILCIYVDNDNMDNIIDLMDTIFEYNIFPQNIELYGDMDTMCHISSHIHKLGYDGKVRMDIDSEFFINPKYRYHILNYLDKYISKSFKLDREEYRVLVKHNGFKTNEVKLYKIKGFAIIREKVYLYKDVISNKIIFKDNDDKNSYRTFMRKLISNGYRNERDDEYVSIV